MATILLVLGCLATGLSAPSGLNEIDVFRHCSIGLLLTLGVSFMVQADGNLRRLVRTDVVALGALYFLTFAEFLNPNVRVLYSEHTGQALNACWLVMITFIAIAVGRHFPLPTGKTAFGLPQLSMRGLFWIAIGCFFLGYLWPLITVGFNPVELIERSLGARFTQPWQRAREGGWSSFLTELKLLHFAYAALIGVMLGGREKPARTHMAVLIFLLLGMLFLDVSQGTRYIFVVKIGLIACGYIAALGKDASYKIWAMSVSGLVIIWIATGEMLRLRGTGLTEYLRNTNVSANSSFLIDNNMITISRAIGVFPQYFDFPGSDIVVSAFTKWVPRALWPGKPAEWTTSLESAFGLDGNYTLAVTFTGEAYLIAGMGSLIFASFVAGSLCATWNRLGDTVRSNLDLMLYVSAFFAAAICMRSLQFVTVALVPTVGLFLFGRLLVRRKLA